MTRFWIVLLGFSAVAEAQAPPAGWQVVKEDQNICLAAVPADWTATAHITGMFGDPKHTSSATLANETLDNFQPLSAEVLKLHDPERVLQNDSKRIILVSKPTTFMKQTTRQWDVWIPAAKGSCHLVIGLGAGADEDLARKIADTLKRAR